MAHRNHQHHLRDDEDSQDPQKFKESIFQPSSDNNKMIEFHRKDSASQKRKLIEESGKFSVIASAPSSPFQLLRQPLAPFASRPGGSDQNLSRLAKDLNEMLRVSDPHVTKEPAKASLGVILDPRKLTSEKHEDRCTSVSHISSESEGIKPSLWSLGSKLKDEEQAGGDVNAAVINSNHSRSLSSTRSITNSSGDVFTIPNPSVSPEISVQQINRSRPNDTYINIPVTLPPASSPHEHNKLGFIVFPVELLNAIISLAVSSKAKDNQVLIYVAVACSTLAFFISSTALVLHKKRPPMAKKMQKAAFLIGTFGFLGMTGMLLPSSISWWFTISAFLVFVLMFAAANLIGREEPG